MRGVVGSRCTLRAYEWEGPEPVEGDFLRTDAGSCYRIDAIRIPDPARVVATKYVLTCTRLDKDAVQFGEPGVHGWVFWARTRGQPPISTDRVGG